MKGQIIKIILTIKERKQLEKILNSYKSTQNDKVKAPVLLLIDNGEHGPKISANAVATKLQISRRTVGRIKEAYALNSSIEDVFRFTRLSNQAKANNRATKNS